MSRDEAARQLNRPAPVKVSDQLRQAAGPEAHRPRGTTYGRHGVSAILAQDAGILGQLRTERAHD